jgi:hypothetical protein
MPGQHGAGKMMPINKMLPIAPKREPHSLGSPDSIQMKMVPLPAGKEKLGYRFEVPNPSGAFEVQAPMGGKIAAVNRLDQSWNEILLDHGDGLQSQLTFPGQLDSQVTDLGPGASIEAGQRLGNLDSKQPALAWNLDWS